MMPLYEFRCEKCDHREQRLQRYEDPPPVCGPCDELMPEETPFMERMISRTTFVLEGGGWARDGYKG